jgi:hypothetical protein
MEEIFYPLSIRHQVHNTEHWILRFIFRISLILSINKSMFPPSYQSYVHQLLSVWAQLFGEAYIAFPQLVQLSQFKYTYLTSFN